MHIDLQTSKLHGNSTDLMYFFVDVYFGSNKQKQSLIVDTGSTITAVPCSVLCTSKTCGKHIYPWFDI